MLDQLLGRAELKDRIAELEDEYERLERRLEAERGRRKDAVRDRQESDERVNRLEDRIAELDGRLERLQTEDRDIEFRSVETIGGERLGEVVDRLASFRTSPEGALTAMLVDDVPNAVRETFGDRTALLSRSMPCLAYADDARLVSVALVPPVRPDPFVSWGDSFRVEREWYLPTGSYALALVRSDLFAFGEYDGRERISYEGFESDVKSDHSKGGFSQARFERIRDDQIDAHLDRCREAIDDRGPDRLFVVGQRTLLSAFRDEALQTATVDATGDPEAALDDAHDRFWRTRLYNV